MNEAILSPSGVAPKIPFDVEALRTDPYAFYARLRRDTPIVRFSRPLLGEAHYVARYDDVMTVLRDTERFANDKRSVGGRDSWLASKMMFELNNTMVMRDGVDHRRLRNLVHLAFTPARVQALAARVDLQVKALLDKMEAKGEAELISDLALPLPITVICDLMGVPESERADFRRWMAGLLDFDGAGMLALVRNVPRMLRLFTFLRRLISLRRKERGEDLLSAMIAAEEGGERLSFDELVASTFLLLLAGHETTVNLIGNGLLALLEHPDQLERLRADPSLVDSAVEELLRYANPVQIPSPRFVREEVELAGVTLRRGAVVLPIVASANRDEARFKDADRLDIARSPNKHVAFGFGAHYCVGAPLARMEARAVFLGLLARFPRLSLAVPREQLRWRRSTSLRGLEALPLRLG